MKSVLSCFVKNMGVLLSSYYSALAIRQLYTARQIVNSNEEKLRKSCRGFMLCLLFSFSSVLFLRILLINLCKTLNKQKINIIECNVRCLFITIKYKVNHIHINQHRVDLRESEAQHQGHLLGKLNIIPAEPRVFTTNLTCKNRYSQKRN